MRPVILCGLGFTTRRLARRFLARGLPTFAAVRNPARFADLQSIGLQLSNLPKDAAVVNTIPPLPAEETRRLRESIRRLEPARVVYISTTGVYGTQHEVDENTAARPSDEKGALRLEDENWLRDGSWETLIVRAAAIYGPSRGVHVRVLEGRLPRTEPGGITSRIHADDLAAVLEAGTFSGLTGAWPVADDEPCPTAEIAEWCGKLLGIALAPAWRDATLVTGRRVNGRKIRESLGVPLAYPNYRSGILASLAEEKALRLRARRAM
jgi:nucleoside-diphosphate-sugar epimerase